MNLSLFKRSAVLLVAGAALSACASMGTVVDEDDPESEIPNVSMGRSIMEGLGAVPARETPIRYTPRGPLVVPADTSSLTPPEDARAVGADWPVDPDVESARLLRQAEARQAARGDKNELVPSSELLAVRTPPSRRLQGDLSLNNKPLRSQELGSMPKGLGGEASLYDAEGRPVRRALTEPPTTYLEPAPGAPVAIPEETSDGKKRGLFSWLPW